MIELRNISRVYKPKRGEPVKALDNVNLTFGSTGMVFVLGKSGSGKSTLLNVIGGLDKYDEGDLLIQGKSTYDFKQSDFDSYRNTMIGFIFQEYNVLDNFTVAQNIGLALQLQGRKATSKAINDILDSVDLSGYARRRPNELSGGQKQRVAIARALVKDPKVIMADEPTGALDSNTGRQVLETLEKLSETRLVIVVSHDRESAETYGSRVIEFKDGEVISDITREKVKKNDDEKPLTFTTTNVKVKQGYELTNDDLKIINNYLKKNKSDTSIDKVFNQATYKPTNQKEIETSRDNYHSIKSKLPFRTSLKIGASSLKHKTMRLVFSIILASVAFAMFGLADTMASYDKYETTAQSMIDSNISYAAVEKVNATDEGDWINERSVKMNDDDITNLNTMFPAYDFLPIYKSNQISLMIGSNVYETSASVSEMSYYIPEFGGIIEFSNQKINSFNITLLGTNSRLPNNFNEIAITKHMYELFENMDYRDADGNKVPILNYNSLLGKTLNIDGNDLEIVGILDTKFDVSRFEPLLDLAGNLADWLLIQEYQTVLNYSHHYAMYVKEGFVAEYTETGLLNFDNTDYQLSLYNNATQNDFWISNVGLIGNLNLNNIQLFNNIGFQTLQANDIIVSEMMFNALDPNIVNNLYMIRETYMRNYVVTISDSVIFEALDEYNFYPLPVEDWTQDDRNNYQNEFYNYFYAHGEDIEYLDDLDVKQYSVLVNEADINYYNSYTPTSLDFSIRNYMTNQIDTKEIRVVGYFKTQDWEDYNSYYFTNDLYNSIDFVGDGSYTSAVSAININDSTTLNKIIAENYREELGMRYTLKNEVLATLNQVNGLVESLSTVFLYVGIGFAVFSALLLLNYITISVSYKKQEIGILRAIGARGRDVVGIFFKEAMIIALINFFVATGIAIFTILTINNQLRNEYGLLLTILNFGIRQVILMLAVSVVVAFVSSSIPVSRIARKRPIDAIRDK